MFGAERLMSQQSFKIQRNRLRQWMKVCGMVLYSCCLNEILKSGHFQNVIEFLG